jgi:hypothetical protein
MIMGMNCGVAPSGQKDVSMSVYDQCCVIVDMCGVNDWAICMDAQNQGFVSSLESALAYKDTRVVVIVDKSVQSFLVKDAVSGAIVVGRGVVGNFVDNKSPDHGTYLSELVSKISS